MASDIKRKLLFLFRLLFRSKRYNYSRKCPYCHSKNIKTIERKYIILELVKCHDCYLNFRFPKDNVSFSEIFYENEYSQDLTTELPSDNELACFKNTMFKNSGKDFSERLEMLKRISNGKNRLLEYGSSWGYFLYQANNYGFDATGIEISKKRASYGVKNLKVKIYNSINDIIDQKFDIIYSCHVIEHVSNLSLVFDFFEKSLTDNGVLILECPNCSSKEAKEQGVYWGPMIGEVHVNAITPEFLFKCFNDKGFSTKMTTEFAELTCSDVFLDQQDYSNLNGGNLILLAKKYTNLL
jgi:2-polyprenyl-3-methyl-5-hydroxy-6-metoxy-1,4-benzoquinol methylase